MFLPEVLVEAAIVGTSYRKLFLYNISAVDSLRALKERILYDLKVAGAHLDSDYDVVLRNYRLLDYGLVSCNEVAGSCALSEDQAGSCGLRRLGRLLTASPSAKFPVDPEDEDRHALLAIACRQLLDRSLGSGAFLPLEARVKPRVSSPEIGPAAAEGDGQITPGICTSESTRRAVTESPAFEITVRDFRGRSHSVRVCGRTSVQRVKQGVATALGCSVVSHWRLFHAGRSLAENLDLGDYNIGQGAVIDIQLTSQQNSLLLRQPSYKGGAPSAVSTPTKDTAAVAAGRKAPGGGPGGGGAGGGGFAAGAGAGNGSALGAQAAAQGGNGGGGGGGLQVGTSQDRAAGASQLNVQVLLPCGLVVHVLRKATDETDDFLGRVLEAQKALTVPLPKNSESVAARKVEEPAGLPTAVEAAGPAATTAYTELPTGVHTCRAVGAAAPEAAEGRATVQARAGAEALASVSEHEPLLLLQSQMETTVAAEARVAVARVALAGAPAAPRLGCGPATAAATPGTGHLPGLIGQKIVALLLAMAAVVVAMAAL